MLGQGDTEGVFQLESSGMKQVLVGLQPQNLEDVIALISLYRPGPMDSIPTYLRNRHEPDKISYKTPQLAHILDVTNGCIVYQEQVMQIFRELAGFSFGQADNVRRAMSKKKHAVMEAEREHFVHGCTDPGNQCPGWHSRPRISSAIIPASLWPLCSPVCWTIPIRSSSTLASAPGWASKCCRRMSMSRAAVLQPMPTGRFALA